MSMTQLLFSFQGRLNRKPYWLTNIAVAVGVIILVAIAIVMVGERKFAEAFVTMAISSSFSTSRCSGSVSPWAPSACTIATSRLGGSSCSMSLPAVASAIGDQMEYLGFVLHLVAFAITVWAFVELGCLRGTVGPNQYGPDPLEPAALGPAAIPGAAR